MTKTKTTIETITIKQIRNLRAEAASVGDTDQVDLCDFAEKDFQLGEYETASVHACVAAINEAEAQDEPELTAEDCMRHGARLAD
jgi:hypothetical protein